MSNCKSCDKCHYVTGCNECTPVNAGFYIGDSCDVNTANKPSPCPCGSYNDGSICPSKPSECTCCKRGE
jgi:hypothetical protein